MKDFAGIVALDLPAFSRADEDRIVNALSARQSHTVSVSRGVNALFAQARLSSGNDPIGAGHVPRGKDSVLSVAAARVDNRDELASALGIDRQALSRLSDALLVQQAFATAGDGGLGKIVGQFALAHWDADRRRLVLARDCLGQVPLFYCARPDFIAFATTLNVLLALPGVPKEIDEVRLGHMLALNAHEMRRTLYRGIERVPSRTEVTIDRAGIRHEHYWSPNLHAPPVYAREQDYVERARELLDQAVAAAMRDTPRAALLLSGGLDSSAIAATCVRLGLADRLSCYTGVPPTGTTFAGGPAWYGDERGKIDVLRRLHPELDVHYVVPPTLHALDRDASRYFPRYGLPVRNVEHMGWFAAIEDAIDPECRVFMAGTRGNFGLSWDGLFSLVELLKAGRMTAFARELAATAKQSGRGMARTFVDEVVRRTAPDSLYRLYHRVRGRNPDDITRYSLLNPVFLADHGLVAQWRTQGHDPYYSIRGTSGARYRADRLFDFSQPARDSQALHFHSLGRSVRAPLGDRRLLEFCLSVPEPMYRQNGIPRSFARRVLADRLPAEILDERRHGAQAPTWFRTLDARRADIARDIERLEASPMASRLLDLPRMKRLLDQWPKDEHVAEQRKREYKHALARGFHVGQFIRWIEGGNE
jgi:asparagine synthase (glutamine-hydrolysing)